MPFESEAQRRFMFAQHPRIAKRWAKETPKGKDLPEKKTDSDPEETKAKAESEKKAFVRTLGVNLGLVKNANPLNVATTKPNAEDILQLDGVNRVLDAASGSMHANRSGRATALAKSIGYDKNEISELLTNPLKTDAAALVLGALPGAFLGQKLGLGALTGGVSGGILGVLLKRIVAQNKMRQIAEQFNEHPDSATFPESAETSTLRSILLPFSGFHSKGESDTARFLAKRTRNAPEFDAGHILNNIPILGLLSYPVTGALQGMAAASNTRRDLMRDMTHVLRSKVQGPRH